jgi:hypothetical protein
MTYKNGDKYDVNFFFIGLMDGRLKRRRGDFLIDIRRQILCKFKYERVNGLMIKSTIKEQWNLKMEIFMKFNTNKG